MLAQVQAYGLAGMDCFPVTVEADVSDGLPLYETVGLPDTAVKESRDRVRASLINSGFFFPTKRILVNLAPADQRKEGPLFDLSIAVAILTASGRIPPGAADHAVFIGELALDGTLRPVRGVLPIGIAAKEEGIRRFIFPTSNALEASCIEGIELIAAPTLRAVVEHLTGKQPLTPIQTSPYRPQPPSDRVVDFAHIRGLAGAKRAMEIAAAGGHNLLLIGAPGGGKTLLARALPGILPSMTMQEALDVTKIQSISGDLVHGCSLAGTRPFRAPHHTATAAAIVGGGAHAAIPGEVSKAHHGVLFLDELPEYRREVLEALRQPLEDGYVTIARVGSRMRYPCSVMLICAMNPCPCGYFGAPGDRCRCSQVEINRYLSRVSGPMLDRIDMHIEVESVPVEELLSPQAPEESSEAVRMRVQAARATQHKRYDEHRKCNAHLDTRDIQAYCALTPELRSLLHRATEYFGLSARAATRVLKVARTIADLAGCESIKAEHLTEAIQYRALDRKYWG